VHLGLPDVRTARAELQALSTHSGSPAPAPAVASPAKAVKLTAGQAILATWHALIDNGSLQAGTPYLAATAKPLRAHLSPATARAVGVVDGAPLTIRTKRGAITLNVQVTAMPDSVVWVPTRSVGSEVHRTLGIGAGAVVTLAGGAA
jgi:NADH-quinone oxidoreductase subunit G